MSTPKGPQGRDANAASKSTNTVGAESLTGARWALRLDQYQVLLRTVGKLGHQREAFLWKNKRSEKRKSQKHYKSRHIEGGCKETTEALNPQSFRKG